MFLQTTGSAVSATGGSSEEFYKQRVVNGFSIYVATALAFLVQKVIKVKLNEPRPDASAPNGYTQARANITFQKPVVLANGKRTVNTIQVISGFDIEMTTADRELMLDDVLSSFIDSATLRSAVTDGVVVD